MSCLKDDQYETIAKPTTVKLTVKKSRFIGVVRAIDSIEAVKLALDTTQHDYPSADHYCYGYQFGFGEDLRTYATDDGEPTNSAGPPILSILQASALSNLICLIVRYYGGINLGIGGLIRAYSQCAKYCLSQARTIIRVCYQQLAITVAYDKVNQIYKLSQKMRAKITNVIYDQNVVIQVKIRLSAKSQFENQLKGMNGVISVDVQNEK